MRYIRRNQNHISNMHYMQLYYINMYFYIYNGGLRRSSLKRGIWNLRFNFL